METRLRVESSSFYIEKLAQTSRAENSNQHCDSVKVHQEPFRGGQIDILKNLSTSYAFEHILCSTGFTFETNEISQERF